jgi:hypothetical protein
MYTTYFNTQVLCDFPTVCVFHIVFTTRSDISLNSIDCLVFVVERNEFPARYELKFFYIILMNLSL